MARIKKPSGSNELKTGNDFIQKAASAGAKITPNNKGTGFTKLETPAGSTYVTPGDTPLDPRTRKNLRHWFRLLGLLVIGPLLCLGVLDYIWGVLQLPQLW